MNMYRVSQLAERTGVPATTLRYYESTGLLPAERTSAGYRLYGEPAVERLGFITTAKQLGLSLDAIAELLPVWESGACAQVKSDLRPRLRSRLAEAEHRRDEVNRFVDALRATLAHLDALPDREGRCDSSCGLHAGATPTDAGADSDPDSDPDSERWREAPVACQLGAEDLGERTDRWHSVLDGAVRESIPDGVRLTLPVRRLAEVADLAAAEQACCPFFDFQFHLDGAHLHLRVRAPEAGRATLAALFDPPGPAGALNQHAAC